MTMFKFRLQRLLDLREQREREMAAELARAESAAAAARAELANLDAVRAIGRERLHAAHATDGTVGELRNLVFVLEQLDAQVAGAQATVTEAEQLAARARGELGDAHRDRRVLDRLRERHATDFRDAAEAADRQTMDAIALTRFTQGAAPALHRGA